MIPITYVPIPSDIYTVIVLPYSAKFLIPQKFHKLLDTKLKYLYDEENCQLCRNYRKHYSCKEDNCRYPLKDYIIHRKTHVIPDAKEYIDNIVKIISNKYIPK